GQELLSQPASVYVVYFFFFSSRRRHTRFSRDWSSDVCSSDLLWASSGERLPPIGLAATDPVRRQRATQRIAELTPTSNVAAASWHEAPASTAPTTRSRKSRE